MMSELDRMKALDMINKLKEAGFSLSMSKKGLSVTKY